MTTSTDGNSLIYLLQVATAGFPTGAFSHSYGFETLIDEDIVNDPASLEREALLWLRHGVAKADGAAVALAYQAASERDFSALGELDEMLSALKLGRESREGSLSTGRSFLDAILNAFPGELSRSYERAIYDRVCLGHYASAFGVAAVDSGISKKEAVLAFMHGSFSNMVGVAARIIPLGQIAVQKILANARPAITECTDASLATSLSEMNSATVRLDVASMMHERLYTRLCIS